MVLQLCHVYANHVHCRLARFLFRIGWVHPLTRASNDCWTEARLPNSWFSTVGFLFHLAMQSYATRQGNQQQTTTDVWGKKKNAKWVTSTTTPNHTKPQEPHNAHNALISHISHISHSAHMSLTKQTLDHLNFRLQFFLQQYHGCLQRYRRCSP